MLRQRQGRQVLAKMELNQHWHENDLVFPNEFGMPLDPATLTRNFEKLRDRAGMPNIRLHDLRNFDATMLLESGTHLKVGQERLGRSSIAITADKYSHVVPSLQRDAADSFADAMDNNIKTVL